MAADTNRNTNKMTRAIACKNKTEGSTAASTRHAVLVSTIAPTGIEPGSDSKSRRDRRVLDKVALLISAPAQLDSTVVDRYVICLELRKRRQFLHAGNVGF